MTQFSTNPMLKCDIFNASTRWHISYFWTLGTWLQSFYRYVFQASSACFWLLYHLQMYLAPSGPESLRTTSLPIVCSRQSKANLAISIRNLLPLDVNLPQFLWRQVNERSRILNRIVCLIKIALHMLIYLSYGKLAFLKDWILVILFDSIFNERYASWYLTDWGHPAWQCFRWMWLDCMLFYLFFYLDITPWVAETEEWR